MAIEGNPIEESSQHNRNLLVFFLMFQVYILVTVGATTHLQLLKPDAVINLPILNKDLSFIGFYILAPLLLLIFHFDILYNLFQHRMKLMEHVSDKGHESWIIFPFLFNFYVFATRGIDRFLLSLATTMVYAVLPLGLFGFIQWRFSSYQSFPMTLWHCIAFLADVEMLFIYWSMIKRPDRAGQPRVLRLLTQAARLSTAALLLAASTGNTVIVYRVAHDTLRMDIYGSSFGNLIHNEYLVPHLELSGQTLLASAPSDTIIQRYIAMGKTELDAYLDFSKGPNLAGRSLRYANFAGAKLFNAGLNNAQLKGARLAGAQLQGASLYYAKLQEADLMQAQMQGAFLSNAQMQGARLTNAQIRGANLSHAQMQGASLNNAQAQGALMDYAGLQGANLTGAQMQGARLGNAQLEGAELAGAQMQGANMAKARLDGADLSKADLRGASLGAAALQASELSGALMQGAFAGDASIGCANTTGVQARGMLAGSYSMKAPEQDIKGAATAIQPMIPAGARESFNALMERANERASKCPKAPPLEPQTDEGMFLDVRAELACSDPDIALGILGQQITLTGGRSASDETITRMKTKCPNTIGEIMQNPKNKLILDIKAK